MQSFAVGGLRLVTKRTVGVTKYAERWGKATTNNKIKKLKLTKYSCLSIYLNNYILSIFKQMKVLC